MPRGDDDLLYLYGDAADQTYVGSFNQSRMTAGNVTIFANSFLKSYIYGMGGNDAAWVTASNGDDLVTAFWNMVKVTTGSRLVDIREFDLVSVFAGEGFADEAVMYDAPTADTFNSNPTSSTYSCAGFRNIVRGF